MAPRPTQIDARACCTASPRGREPSSVPLTSSANLTPASSRISQSAPSLSVDWSRRTAGPRARERPRTFPRRSASGSGSEVRAWWAWSRDLPPAFASGTTPSRRRARCDRPPPEVHRTVGADPGLAAAALPPRGAASALAHWPPSTWGASVRTTGASSSSWKTSNAHGRVRFSVPGCGLTLLSQVPRRSLPPGAIEYDTIPASMFGA